MNLRYLSAIVRRYSCGIVLAYLVLLIGCSGESQEYEFNDFTTEKLKVITTVSPITSLVENIGGVKIELEGIVPEGTNSHTFAPSPSVVRTLSEADLIVVNGLFLEEPSIRLAEDNKKSQTKILSLAEKTVSPEEWIFDFAFPSSGGKPNPHLWTAPHLGIIYAELIKDELASLDEKNRSYYEDNYEKLSLRLLDLDQRITKAVHTIPEDNRKLLTYHDSFPYFAPRYGFEIIGAIQPSDFTEPSARDVAELIDLVKSTNVPAIFGSEVFPSPVMKQVAKEGGAQYIDKLRDDDLPGRVGDPLHSYMGLIVTDVEVIVLALGGSIEALNGFDARNVFEGDSKAIYPQ